MLKGRTKEMVIIEMAHLKGLELNVHEMLQIRSNVASSLAAKERYHQRISARSFRWNKPKPPRSVI